MIYVACCSTYCLSLLHEVSFVRCKFVFFSISFLLDLHLIYLHLYLLQQVAYSKVFDTVSDVPVNEHQLGNH